MRAALGASTIAIEAARKTTAITIIRPLVASIRLWLVTRLLNISRTIWPAVPGGSEPANWLVGSTTFASLACAMIVRFCQEVVTSEVADNVPQLAVIGPYLPTHWWLSFDSILRVPVDTSALLKGLLSFGVYAVLFGSFAWARFTSADVTS